LLCEFRLGYMHEGARDPRINSQRPTTNTSGTYLYRVSLSFSEDFDIAKLGDVLKTCFN
jgi:hypothetical protein